MRILTILFTMFLVVQSLERKQGVTESFNQYLIIGKDFFEKVSTTRGNFEIGEDYQNLDELSNDHVAQDIKQHAPSKM